MAADLGEIPSSMNHSSDFCAEGEVSGNSIKKKCLLFYFRGSEQKLILYEGATPQEILFTLKSLLGIKEDQKITFLEENGIPLVLSSFMPDNTKIFVSLGDKITGAIYTPGKSQVIQWKWFRQFSIADFISDVTFKTFGELRTVVYGETIKTNGKHYWRIKISHLMCCHDFGICDGILDADFDVSYHTPSEKVVGIPGILPPNYKLGPAGTGCSNLYIINNIFGIFADLDKKVCLIVNETANVLYTKKVFKFDSVVPFYVARKHKVEVTLIETGLNAPTWVTDLA